MHAPLNTPLAIVIHGLIDSVDFNEKDRLNSKYFYSLKMFTWLAHSDNGSRALAIIIVEITLQPVLCFTKS